MTDSDQSTELRDWLSTLLKERRKCESDLEIRAHQEIRAASAPELLADFLIPQLGFAMIIITRTSQSYPQT